MRIDETSAGRWRRRHLLGHVVLISLFGAAALSPTISRSQAPLFLGVTTSTENSGLLAHLVAAFAADHDIQIRAVTAGSGAVLNLAARGDVDVILVHSPEDEDAFIESGYGVDRRPVMRNRFVIVGPKPDPAGIGEAGDAKDAFEAIAAERATFLSRGDESGTYKAELRLWQSIGIDPVAADGWYRQSGSGQGATLNIAANTGAYTLTDEATWATFGNRGGLENALCRRRCASRQCLQRDSRRSRSSFRRQCEGRADLRRLADVANGPGGDRHLRGWRSQVVSPGGRARRLRPRTAP